MKPGRGAQLIALIALLTVVTTKAQYPRRLQIPGAIPLGPAGGARPLPPQPAGAFRAPVPIRRPQPVIRPVVEELEEEEQPVQQPIQQINREPQIRLLQQQLRLEQEEDDEDDRPQAPVRAQPAPVAFRPERPAVSRPRVVQQQQQQQPQQPRRHQQQYAQDPEGRRERTTKPPVKILRKYREDNPDGSITWGYENDDGTFKEETIGIDCITRGKYGYIDPDGNRREYSYETGLKCDEPEEEDPETLIQNPQYQNQQGLKRPIALRPL